FNGNPRSIVWVLNDTEESFWLTRLYGLTLWLCRVLSSADNQRLTLTGCGLQRQQALLPRDRHPAPETQRLHPAPDKASL
ncbi:hypothetical protein M3I67_02165, partial [Escherichia coli]|nr:hypothetical protein [Escherichia coli]